MSDEPALDLRPLGIGPLWWMAGAFAVLVLVLVLRWLVRVRQESSSDHIAGEVVGVIGRPGSGKTLFAVRYAAKHLKAGGAVCTNFSMAVPKAWPGRWSKFTGWADLVKLQDCVVVLDEAHLIAPSTVTGSPIPTEARWYLSQVRRMGVTLVWVSQHEMRVNKTLRELTNYIWVCNSYRRGQAFKATQYEPELLRKPEKHLEIRRWRADPKIWPLFDSWELLQPGGTTDTDRQIKALAEARNRRRAVRGDAMSIRGSGGGGAVG